jgi:hypothetical protein
MSETVSKPRRAYCRKLLLAHTIASERHDLLSLEAATGMPRRTLQDAIKAMADIGIGCEFMQDGPKHRHGYYRIDDWGDHDRRWIAAHLAQLQQQLAD